MKRENRVKSNPMTAPVCWLSAENFNREVLAEDKPVLLLCVPKDSTFSGQMSVIETLQHDFPQSLKICLMNEDFLAVFMERYQVRGTPTFLVFTGGRERERLLGRATEQDLKRFVQQALPELNPSVG